MFCADRLVRFRVYNPVQNLTYTNYYNDCKVLSQVPLITSQCWNSYMLMCKPSLHKRVCNSQLTYTVYTCIQNCAKVLGTCKEMLKSKDAFKKNEMFLQIIRSTIDLSLLHSTDTQQRSANSVQINKVNIEVLYISLYINRGLYIYICIYTYIHAVYIHIHTYSIYMYMYSIYACHVYC